MAEQNNLEPEKQETSGAIRDKDGKYLIGYSGNIKGRPKGLSLVSLLKEGLNKIPDGEKESYGEKIIRKIIIKASDGDQFSQKLIFGYVEGTPLQRVKQIEVREDGLSEEEKQRLNKLFNLDS